MAEQPIGPKHLQCKIKDIKPDQARPGRTIVSIEFDDGNKELGPWHQGYSIIADQIVTIEDLMQKLIESKPERPLDPMSNLKSVMATGEKFVLNLTAIIEKAEQN